MEFSQELGTARPRVNLDGKWDFSYDPREVGETEGWFRAEVKLPEVCEVPGCDQVAEHASAGISEREFRRANADHFMSELKHPCVAPAWHRRRFLIPLDWRGQDVMLRFGGINPAADVWMNGVKLGNTSSSRVPVRCDITKLVEWGGENTVVVKTYWPGEPRLDGLFEMMYAFSGLYRSVWVEATPATSIRELQVIGSINPTSVTANVWLEKWPDAPGNARMRCDIADATGETVFSAEAPLTARGSESEPCTIALPMPGAKLWEPGSPTLYRATVTVLRDGRTLDLASTRFGLREIRCNGLRVLLNGKPIFLRGGCDDQPYPGTICPPASKAYYVERLKKSLKYGFNYTKSCMEIFTPEYLDAADETGMLVCQEMPFGLVGDRHTAVYRPMEPERREMFRRELRQIVRADRNHPSVILYSMASEFYTSQLTDEAFSLFCQELPATTRSLNPTALVMDITCTMGAWTGQEKRGPRSTDIIEDYLPNQERQEPLCHPIPGRYDELDRPFIIHEYNWWTALPDPEFEHRYIALPTKATGIPQLKSGAGRIGVAGQLPVMVANSRMLKYSLQKCGIEVARRNPKISGYHFWLVAGLSYCQEGVLDEFFEEPPDLNAETFRTYNADTVLLLDDDNRRVFELGRPIPVGIQVSHFGLERLNAPVLEWQLMSDEAVISENCMLAEQMECGTLSKIYPIAPTIPQGDTPLRLELHVSLSDGGKAINRNVWSLWVVPAPDAGAFSDGIMTDLQFLSRAYPAMRQWGGQALKSDGSGVRNTTIVTDHLDDTLMDHLDRGGRVVLLSNRALKDYGLDVEWMPGVGSTHGEPAHNNDLYRTVAYSRDSHGNMGTVVADHPALGGMPHDGWCDLNFRHLIGGALPIVLEYFHPAHIAPIIRSIGHQKTMVDKAYLFEVRVGKGALLATSLRFVDTWDAFPESRYLLDSILRYVVGNAFAPRSAITRGELEHAILERRSA